MQEKVKKRLWIVAAIICICVLVIGAVGYHVAKNRAMKIAKEKLELLQPIDKEEIKEMSNANITEETTAQLRDRWTVAAFGLDCRNSNELKTGNSDVIILMDMNGKTGEIKLVSVYRDTCLKTGENSYRKANAAYATGGPKQTVKMLNENLDLEIDDYVAVTWKSVAEAINLLGGVDLEVSKSEFRYINAFITETVKSTKIGSYQLKQPGMQHLDGVQAVAYCRLRLMDSDFKRTERQRKVLQLALEKAKHADFATLNNIIETVFPQTASSIETEDLITLSRNILKLHIGETSGFPTTYTCKTVGGADYVFPESLEENVSVLHDFLYGTKEYQPSKHVQEISNRVKQKESDSEKSSTSKKETTQSETETETKKEKEQEETRSTSASDKSANDFRESEMETRPSVDTTEETTNATNPYEESDSKADDEDIFEQRPTEEEYEESEIGPGTSGSEQAPVMEKRNESEIGTGTYVGK